MSKPWSFFATAAKQLEPLLAEELAGLGCNAVQEERGGVRFEGPIADAYRVCLWSRLASRVLMPMKEAVTENPDELYELARGIDWSQHLRFDGTLAVDVASHQSSISHTQYAAQRVKDAIVDQFREETGQRPSVELHRPHIRINVYIMQDRATISLDLSGESLHRRGYRQAGGYAPLKENLAAALLLRAGWPELARQGRGLIDPMCGSGTFVIEAALMATDRAPGLLRSYFGFFGWLGHDAESWQQLIDEARGRHEAGRTKCPQLAGADQDARVIRMAQSNATRAGVSMQVRFSCREIKHQQSPSSDIPAGLVIANPPYGHRIGEHALLANLYRELGERLKAKLGGWRIAILSADLELAKATALSADKRYVFYNGPIKSWLIIAEIDEARRLRPIGAARTASRVPCEMLANRLKKNLRNVAKWVKKNAITCYRLYDRDLPEYALAIDIYEQHAHLQEYAPPKQIDPGKSERRLKESIETTAIVLEQELGIEPRHIHVKTRTRQRGIKQYERFEYTERFIPAQEGGYQFYVNLDDYLDTGLFLDHRNTRSILAELTPGKTFLNLFAYTGAATVYAVGAGAKSSTTVDLSNTYLEWAKRNMGLNRLRHPHHEFVRADCLEWLRKETRMFDVIFLDPPTFSNSSSMAGTLDIQRDHVEIISIAMKRLNPDGTLLFSNNNRSFKMDRESLQAFELKDITRKTIPDDFKRNTRIHNAWLIRYS